PSRRSASSLLAPLARVRRDLHSFPTRRSSDLPLVRADLGEPAEQLHRGLVEPEVVDLPDDLAALHQVHAVPGEAGEQQGLRVDLDRKSTRLNSSHVKISYAVFCLKKKKTCIVR